MRFSSKPIGTTGISINTRISIKYSTINELVRGIWPWKWTQCQQLHSTIYITIWITLLSINLYYSTICKLCLADQRASIFQRDNVILGRSHSYQYTVNRIKVNTVYLQYWPFNRKLIESQYTGQVEQLTYKEKRQTIMRMRTTYMYTRRSTNKRRLYSY